MESRPSEILNTTTKSPVWFWDPWQMRFAASHHLVHGGRFLFRATIYLTYHAAFSDDVVPRPFGTICNERILKYIIQNIFDATRKCMFNHMDIPQMMIIFHFEFSGCEFRQLSCSNSSFGWEHCCIQHRREQSYIQILPRSLCFPLRPKWPSSSWKPRPKQQIHTSTKLARRGSKETKI